jgi:hypothetical protein
MLAGQQRQILELSIQMNKFNYEFIDAMSGAEEEQFWLGVKREFQKSEGEAAQEELAAGRPIYYCDERYELEIVQGWPDGTKYLVTIDKVGTILHRRSWPL